MHAPNQYFLLLIGSAKRRTRFRFGVKLFFSCLTPDTEVPVELEHVGHLHRDICLSDRFSIEGAVLYPHQALSEPN